jgi:5'-nucleotidase / UDP-sugar diphosphatase
VERLTILHTADLHGGRDGARERVSQLLGHYTDALWLDSGDALQAPNLSFGLTWESTFEWMSELGCRAMALGNREFELTQGSLARKLRAACFPIVCTNLVVPPDTTVPVCREVLLATPSGKRIRVLGALRDMVCDVVARSVSPFRFRDPLEAVTEQASEAGEDELVILLSHLGEEADVELLARAPRLDLILGGHSHRGWLHREGWRVATSRPWTEERTVTRLTLDLDRVRLARAGMGSATEVVVE